MKKVYRTAVVVSTLVILSACANDQPAELMFEHLEESVQIEQEIDAKQGPLTEAEQNEVELYEEMLSLSSVEEIEPLADEAIESAETRKEIMEEELELIEESYSIFQEAEQHVESIDEEEEERALGEELVEVMGERYEIYLQLHEEYMTSIDEDIQLYNMAKDEEVEFEELEAQHEAVNESYSRVTDLNGQFNELTNAYNDAKVAFYEESDLNVSFE